MYRHEVHSNNKPRSHSPWQYATSNTVRIMYLVSTKKQKPGKLIKVPEKTLKSFIGSRSRELSEKLSSDLPDRWYPGYDRTTRATRVSLISWVEHARVAWVADKREPRVSFRDICIAEPEASAPGIAKVIPTQRDCEVIDEETSDERIEMRPADKLMPRPRWHYNTVRSRMHTVYRPRSSTPR